MVRMVLKRLCKYYMFVFFFFWQLCEKHFDCPALTYYPILVILQDEFEMNMRLIGAPTIKDIRRDMVDASSLGSHIGATPSDKLYDSNCKLLKNSRVKIKNDL